MVSDNVNRQSVVEQDVEASGSSRMSRCRQKFLCELDTIRRQNCQGKICNMVMKVQQSSNASAKEKMQLQEKVWIATQKKYLKEEEEIYLKLHEEEEESRKRQEQIIIEHEQHAKRLEEMNKIITRVEEREREREERNKQMILLTRAITEKCFSLLTEYRSLYEKFLDLIKTCKDKKALGERNSSEVAKLKSFSEIMNTRINDKCKNMSINEEDLQICTKTVEEFKLILKQFEADIGIVNSEHDKVAQAIQAKENAAKESAAALKQQNLNQEPSTPSVPNWEQTPVGNSAVSKESSTASAMKEYVNEEAYERYNSLIAFQDKFAKSYESLLKDETMKKFRFECQKAVNTPVNAICPINAAHLQDKLTKLHRLLSGASVESGRSHFSAAQHPQGVAFCKDLLAKKFVAQGETTVASKPEAAFAIAAVMVSLWSDFPDFGNLVLSHFYKECPYLVPFFKPRLVGQSDMEYYKSLGYRYSENGEVEKQDKFLKRMSGIMHLYCAVIITPLRRQSGKIHPLGLKEAWRWIASVINLEPRPDICAILLYEFLEVSGYSMFHYYGAIFQKLLHLLCTEYYLKLEDVTPKALRGPVARLESFLQKILKQGRINPPTGLLPVDFW